MDSNQIRAPREPWQTRRLSQDINMLHATLAARSGRLAPTANHVREDARPQHLPETIQEEDYAKFTTGLDRPYESFLSRLRLKLMALKDDKGTLLYTPQQVRAQLGEANQTAGDHDRCFGEYGGITYFTRTDTGMEHLHEYVPVDDMTWKSDGFVRMDQKWQDTFENADVAFRWIHLPANNMEWARSTMGHILRHYIVPKDSDSTESTGSDAPLEDQIMSQELWDDQQNIGLPELPHARFMRPFCRRIDIGVGLPLGPATFSAGPRHNSAWNIPQPDPIHSALANSLVIFMPFLHWESTLAYLHMQNVVEDVDMGGIGVFCGPDIAKIPCGIDEKLLRHYLQHLQPVHVRRTLDQFGYYTIADTTSRDKDQVVDRYARMHRTTDLVVPPMLMVDQCWLWVLGNNTILTCFPHRWNKNINQVEDPTDVYQSILELLDDSLHRLTTATIGQLAFLIIDRCAMNVLDRNLIKDNNLRFLDFFDWSIDDLNEAQSKCLQALWKDVQSRTDENADALIDISKEFDILEKIKDIIDELQIMARISDQQVFAFNMALKEESTVSIDLADRISDGADATQILPRPVPGTEIVDFAKLRDRAEDRGDNIRAMIERANATYDATLDVLSLKQQQANISEARSSRRAAQEMEKMAKEAKKAGEEAEKQGYSIMLFTIVTIFFLPMSAIAGIFGVNAVEFGQGMVHLSTIFAYMIPISVFVVYISFLLAFNHKARRTILLILQIFRAYINLALPIVFDEHKESTLQQRLEHLRERRHLQRERKLAKIKAAASKSEKAADDEEKEESDLADEENPARNSGNGHGGRPSLHRYESKESAAFRWRRFNTRSKEADSEAGQPPSETGSTGHRSRRSMK